MQINNEHFDRIAFLILHRKFEDAEDLLRRSSGNLAAPETILLEFMLAEEKGAMEAAANIAIDAWRKGILPALPRRSVVWLADHLAHRKAYRCGLELVNKLPVQENDWQIITQKARFLALNRQFEESLKLLRTTWPFIPKDREQLFRLFEARLLLNLGQTEEAYPLLKKWLKRPIRHESLYHRASVIAVQRQDWPMAKRFLDHITLEYGETSLRRARRARIGMHLQQYQSAINHANEALNRLNGYGIEKVRISRQLHFLKSDAWLARGIPFNAISDLQKYLENDPEWTEGKLRVIECCLQAAKPALAAELFEKWFMQTELTAEILSLKCRIAAQTGDTETALTNIRLLGEKWPDHELHPALVSLVTGGQSTLQPDRLQEISFPDVFAPKWQQKDLETKAHVIRGMAGHFKSVHALILRETKSRFGNYKLGFLWAVLEPAIYTSIFVGIFYAIGRQTLYGMSVPLFVMTGIIPYSLFRNCFDQMVSAVSSNKAILVHPRIQVLDLIISKASLEFATILTVFLIFLSALYSYFGTFFIGNILEIILGFSGLAACGIGFGLITAGIASVFPGVGNLLRQAARLLFFTSGVFYAPEMLPAGIRDQFLVWNPLTHFISLVRNNFTPYLTSENIDFSYALLIALMLLFFGFMLQRIFHFRMQTQ